MGSSRMGNTGAVPRVYILQSVQPHGGSAVYMRQEKLRLLAVTGSAGHRNVETSTGWHSQHGQQGKGVLYSNKAVSRRV